MPPGDVITQVRRTLDQIANVSVHFDPAATEPTPGSFVPITSDRLHRDLAQVLQAHCPSGFFRHQGVAIDQILDGHHTVVSTQTSSGKSLIFSTPVFNALLSDPDATALFIYPQKALANDQHAKLAALATELPSLQELLASNPHLVSRYDGATPDGDKKAIQSQVRIMLTNPDMLHIGILQHHERLWSRFFKNLRYIIVDECHEYRGIFGTNVAYVLRRIRQACAVHGSSPTIVATSATIREPQQHLEKLTGLAFTSVGPGDDGSIQGRKKYWMLSADEHFYDVGRKLSLALAREGLSVLTFCPSRVSAERMMSRILSAKDDELPFVRVYRAGLTPEEREGIETGLRDKSVRLVFSTSALELGIDIGALDVVVCIGLPSSMMSLWQRAGRVARAGKEGAIVLIPADTPIDSYYSDHPDELFAKENEPLALNLTNRRVVYCHYACAVKEVGGVEDRLRVDSLGDTIGAVADLRKTGAIQDDIFYRTDPYPDVNIRSMGEGSYALMCDQNKVGEIDEYHLLREAYKNAIYRHGGAGYRVTDVVKGKKVVRLRREYFWNETTAILQKQLRLKRRHATAEYSVASVATVDVDVTEYIVTVVEKDRSGKVVNQWQGSAGMPAHTLPTVGTQLLLRSSLWAELAETLGAGPARIALISCERLLSSLFPTISGPCDLQDFSSFSEVLKDGSAALYLYDNVYDGVDLTTGAFDNIENLVEKSLERVQTCSCQVDSGCFRCIANPRADEATSKYATMRLLSEIRDVFLSEPAKITKPEESPAMLVAPDAVVQCPKCGKVVAKGDRFCKNCGHNLLG